VGSGSDPGSKVFLSKSTARNQHVASGRSGPRLMFEGGAASILNTREGTGSASDAFPAA
jgi:hypothetical protein